MSVFCATQVVAAGLSGAFSSLPRKLLIVSDDWFQIGDDDVAQSVSLKQFLDMFDFCNAIVQVCSLICKLMQLIMVLLSFFHCCIWFFISLFTVLQCFALYSNIFKPKATLNLNRETNAFHRLVTSCLRRSYFISFSMPSSYLSWPQP